MKQSLRDSGTETTSRNFLVAFDEKYFLYSIKERKEVQSIELQQGGMTVEQYTAKFAKLSKYAPHIINTEAQKVAKFEMGRRPDIRGRVLSANLKSYALLVDLSLKIERDYKYHRSRKEMNPMPSRKFGKKPKQFPRRDVRGGPYQHNQRAQKDFPGNRENGR
ncbi:uncharacterized protein LOC105420528 [Amborella trichopoda]|uniref:uncharacterized protein LOC105420528 n=1 Tax=Amborella trichopoda TaxID=13333 RepID=UPI0005D3D34D|nr:uncharacterized protein LOC105420528 [Amborella trichopoda]|eukprot:XP_011622813.1 uncharacterized protein LOC105420528 [Amborella trichopoda]